MTRYIINYKSILLRNAKIKVLIEFWSILLVTLMFMPFITACGQKSLSEVELSIIGKWTSQQEPTTFEFFADGSFNMDSGTGKITKGMFRESDHQNTLANKIFVLDGTNMDIQFSNDGSRFVMYIIDDAMSSEAFWSRAPNK